MSPISQSITLVSQSISVVSDYKKSRDTTPVFVSSSITHISDTLTGRYKLGYWNVILLDISWYRLILHDITQLKIYHDIVWYRMIPHDTAWYYQSTDIHWYWTDIDKFCQIPSKCAIAPPSSQVPTGSPHSPQARNAWYCLISADIVPSNISNMLQHSSHCIEAGPDISRYVWY